MLCSPSSEPAAAPLALAAGAAQLSDGNRATPQGGVLDGASPAKYDAANPIILFIIQICLIVVVCHALHWPLAKIRQPRVIAEVVGGILLGPLVMGRVPGFRSAIFPKESLPNLNLVANLGLVLYLIGLETDVRFLVRHWRVATSVAFAGLALPFGIGCVLAWGVYHAFRDDDSLQPIRFSVYMLFIGIALAITVRRLPRAPALVAPAHSPCSPGFPRPVPHPHGAEAARHLGRCHHPLGRCGQRCR